MAIVVCVHPGGAKDATGGAFRAVDKAQLLALGLPQTYSPIARIMVVPTAKLHLVMAAIMLGAAVWAVYSVFTGRRTLPSGILAFFAIGLIEPALACITHRQNFGIFLATFSTPTRYFYLLGIAAFWVLGKELAGRGSALRAAGFAGAALAFALLLALKPEYLRRTPLEDYRWGRYAEQIGAKFRGWSCPSIRAGGRCW